MECKEFYLDDMRAITAIPVADVDGSLPSSPVNSPSPTVPSAGFDQPMTHAVTIGLQPAVEGGLLIPIRSQTGKAKDEEGDSVAGRLHTVTVTCEVDDRDASVWPLLLTLERTPCHLLLTFRDGLTRGLVVGGYDTWACVTERDGKKTAVTIRVRNLMGVQLLV